MDQRRVSRNENYKLSLYLGDLGYRASRDKISLGSFVDRKNNSIRLFIVTSHLCAGFCRFFQESPHSICETLLNLFISFLFCPILHAEHIITYFVGNSHFIVLLILISNFIREPSTFVPALTQAESMVYLNSF
jgi:hypothetical protein